MSDSQLKVTHVAIKTKENIYAEPLPAAHHEIVPRIYQAEENPPATYEMEFGFLLSDDSFATRREAGYIAHEANQTHPNSKFQPGNLLFSIDLL